MRKPRLFRWIDPVSISGLLMVAQRVEESLFDYSVDTYKTPALNTRTRCLELIQSIDHVKSGHLSEKSLKSIVEELSWSIDQDPAARELLGSLSADFKSADWWSMADLRQLKTQANLLRGRLRNRAYERELIAQIRLRLDDGKRRAELLKLSTSLVVEWLSRGFSRGFIFMITRAFFFSPSSAQIKGVSSFDEFVKRFEGTKKKHDVLVRMNEASVMLSGLLPTEVVTFSKDAPEPRLKSPKEIAYLKVLHDGAFAIFHDVEALDPRAAYDEALRRLDIAARLVAFHAHRNRLAVIGDGLVYYESEVTVLKQSPLPVHKEGDRDPEEIPSACATTILKFFPPKGTKESWARILAALGLHSSAVSVKDTAVQLTALWSALEALLPISADQVKITLVLEYLVPILCRRYPMRLLAQLDADLKTCCPDSYEKVCSQLPMDVPEHMRCAAIVAIQTNESLRDQLYEDLSHNPLLKNRLYQLKKDLESANRITELLNRHRQKVTWHIRRIYRSRNLVTHAGQTLPYVASLVENLHAYFHRTFEAVEECVAPPHNAPDVDAALVACQLEDRKHREYLRDHAKSDITLANMAHFLSGPVFAETAQINQLEQRNHDQSPDL